jgi:undecaprenyl-diphosphatase
MSILQALILGIVQGLTEYIPVSSTAHLILVPWLFGWNLDIQTKFVFDILVQWGTLVGVVVYFWHDIWAIVRAMLDGLIQRRPLGTTEARLGWYVIVATIPAVIFGLVLKKYVEELYSQYLIIAVIVILAAGLMLAAERFGKRTRQADDMTAIDAGAIGLWQVLAFAPGVSRSSATISGGMLRHLQRADAARFSFLISIPALLGAGVIALKDLFSVPGLLASLALPLAVGFVSAAISGYFSIRWLLSFLQRRSLNVFTIYRLVFGIICIVLIVLSVRAASG